MMVFDCNFIFTYLIKSIFQLKKTNKTTTSFFFSCAVQKPFIVRNHKRSRYQNSRGKSRRIKTHNNVSCIHNPVCRKDRSLCKHWISHYAVVEVAWTFFCLNTASAHEVKSPSLQAVEKMGLDSEIPTVDQIQLRQYSVQTSQVKSLGAERRKAKEGRNGGEEERLAA